MRQQQRGFTLIEIAIVLVIIGLLLGGVLKGQELITQAKIKNVANDMNGVSVAIYAYQDRYKRLPGDDNGATARWTTIALNQGNGNSQIAGTYNSVNDADETRAFWSHLRFAGLISGPTDTVANASAQPTNAAGGITGVQQGALSLGGLVVCSGKLPAKIAQAVDSQFDDGVAGTGSVRAIVDAAVPTTDVPVLANAVIPNYVDNNNNLYVVCKAI
jgi:prepilin-type N-terminal cleavage/methylation domain-containing protein